MRHILYTRHDGGVSVCTPAAEIFHIMQNGGFWNDKPSGFVQTQIERQIASGIDPDHARRFAHAVAFGGCSEAEAWEIIRDRDCARHGTNHALIDTSELPDRWFRDAWVRGHNSGHISICLDKARPIQWRRLMDAVSQENKRREFDLFGPAPIRISKAEYQTAIKHARDDEELRRIWVPGLSSPLS